MATVKAMAVVKAMVFSRKSQQIITYEQIINAFLNRVSAQLIAGPTRWHISCNRIGVIRRYFLTKSFSCFFILTN